MKREPIHYKRFYTDHLAFCGVKLDDGPGTIVKRTNTIFHNQTTCKNCLRKINKDIKKNDN